MSLQLVTGAANAGKTGIVLNEALAAAAEGASPVLVVPRQPDVRRLEKELAEKAVLGIAICTLEDLVLDLWMLHGDGRRIVGRYAREAILAAVMEEGFGEALGPAGRSGGFRRLLARLARFSALKTPDDAPDGIAGVIAELVAAYRVALADAGLLEAAWAAEILAQRPPELAGPVGATRFDTLSPAEARFLMGLASCNAVTVALTWEDRFAPTEANDAIVQLLANGAQRRVLLGEPVGTTELQRLARSLFAGPSEIQSVGAVTVGLASGVEAEAALVARAARRAIDSGTAPERIVVAYPSLDHKGDALRAALRGVGIQAGFDMARPFSSTEFGRAYRGLLAAAAGVGARAEAMEYLASPYSGASALEVHRLDRMWRTERIVDSSRLMRGMLGKLGESSRDSVIAARNVVGSTLTSGTLANWNRIADGLLANAAAHPETGEWDAAADGAAHRALSQAVAEMAQVKGASFHTVDVLAALSGIEAGGNWGEPDGVVQVCEFSAVGARRFDVVILAGLTESELPTATRESLEDDLRSANGVLGEADRGEAARLQFYSLVTRARNHLVLIRQDADGDGRERRASALLEDVLEAYRPVGAAADEVAPSPPPCERITKADIEELAPALTEGRWERRQAARRMVFRHSGRGEVASKDGLAALSGARVFSATEIETYLACPYRWFYERVVRPEEIDMEFDSREKGSRAHELLAAFYRRFAGAAGAERVTPDGMGEALRLFEEVARSEVSRRARTISLAEQLAEADAVRWARDVIGEDGLFLPGFVATHVELKFGYGEPFEFAGAPFCGRIDRVDVSSSSAFVTDYKSSRTVSGLEKFEADGKIQAVVYALAVHEILGLPVSGSAYRSMTSGKLGGFWRSDLLEDMPLGMCADDVLDKAGFDALVARTEERVGAAIEGMRSGCVQQVPRIKGACSYCVISTICEGAVR